MADYKGRLTWKEIVERYPSKWVFLDEVEYKEKEMVNVKDAVVVNVVDDDQVDEIEREYYEQGKRYEVLRTTDDMSIGVINCENYKLNVY